MQTPEPDPLEQLQSSKQVALLDAIDKLRNQGVSHHNISLPQLIVCGDQSSGKSSVLEGLTRLNFPTKEGLCTTFATEVVLRKGSEVKISCSIIPGANRSQAQIEELSKFRRVYSTREHFPFTTLVDEAKEQMTFGTSSSTTSFFDDVLQIRYTGPDVPSLTVCDLPGLIQSQIEGRKDEGVQQVHAMVDRYMRNEKSIILAIVSARNDIENQSVFKKIQTVDPNGNRSLGIITKPDLLDAQSETEARFIGLAKNQFMTLELGWHVIRNRGYGEADLSHADRDREERNFFATGAWKSLPQSDVGIDALRSKLSEVLLRHICKELPAITEAIHEAISTTESKLKLLGSPRETHQQQRLYLIENAEGFQRLTDRALRGIYDDKFFSLSSTRGRGGTRLRTEIQNLNIAFAYTMYRKGNTWDIIHEQVSHEVGYSGQESRAITHYDAAFPDPEPISRDEFVQEHIAKYVQESRPSGLLSLVNPGVIAEVFREQSEKWEDIAKHHVEQVFQAVKNYLLAALESLVDSRTFYMLMLEQLEPELDRKREALQKKLAELLCPYREQEPVMYDPTFAVDLDNCRARRYRDANCKGPQHQPDVWGQGYRRGSQLLTESIDGYTNSEILDLMQTYYRKSLSIFINNVAVLAVENCLVSGLSDIFSPSLVSAMSKERLQTIASESEEVQTERAALKQKLVDLKNGKRVLDVQACNTKSGMLSPTGARTTRTLSPHTPASSRSQTPTPQTKPTVSNTKDLETMASGFRRLSVTPPATPPRV